MIEHTDEARLAIAAGYDPGDPAEFLGAMIRLKDDEPYRRLATYLAERNMTVGQLWDIVTPAIDAERAARAESKPRGGERGINIPLSPEARTAIVRLRARAFEVESIARLLEIDPVEVEGYLAFRGAKVDEQAVLTLHDDGKSPVEIAKILGVQRTSIYPLLHRLGAGRPHCTKPRVAFEMREAIIRLRNAGKTNREIVASTGASDSQVKSVLRTAAKKGAVRDYGVRS